MQKLLFVLIVASCLIITAAAGAFAQTVAPNAAATPVVVTAAPLPASPASARPHVARPVPSILPTLRLIDSGMLPTLSFLLNLTDDQKTKAEDLLSKADEDRKPKVAAQVKAASEYIALLGKTSSSQADLTAAAQKVLAADNDLMAARIKALVAFRTVLTPEQNARLAKELQETASRWLPQDNAAGPPLAPGK